MPAWPGGPCPGCGDDMPANLVHCQTCRHLLNDDLSQDSIEIPVFQPLREIENVIETEPAGYYMACPHCRKELRFKQKYVGQRVGCKFCDEPFTPSRDQAVAFFIDCPHCAEELKNDPKYIGMKVACKHCSGHINLIEAH